MRTNKKNITVAAIFVFFIFNAFAMASPAGSTYSLTATKNFPGASGAAVVNDTNIDVNATGLKPNSVYTVWFVNMKPKKQETGAGQPPYMFKTDAKGQGTYSAPLKESPGSWQMLMIVEHPNGDPRDMKNMIGALTADLG